MSVLAPDVLRDDTTAWPAMLSLLDCLCAEVSASGLDTCMCTLLPGQAVPGDYVTEDSGMAWVRLVSMFPSSQLPLVDQSANGCLVPLAYTLEMGALFCAPVAEDSRTPPSLGSNVDATRVQMAALAAMRRALECCLGAKPREVVLGQYTPVGPAGGAVGGTWLVTLSERAVVRP